MGREIFLFGNSEFRKMREGRAILPPLPIGISPYKGAKFLIIFMLKSNYAKADFLY